MDEAQVHQIIEANNGVLLKQMSDLISAQVASLKRSAEDSVSIIREIKKINTADARPVFKKKSNEEQYNASTKVLDTLEDAKYNLESNNLEAAKTAVDQGISLVKERQKLILLADKSQYGWKTVQEYLQHELADDSGTTRKRFTVLRHAQRRARKDPPSNGMLLEVQVRFLRLNLFPQPQFNRRLFPLLCPEERLMARFPEFLVHRGSLPVLVLHVERSVTGERVVR